MPELIKSTCWQFHCFNEWVKQVLIKGVTSCKPAGTCSVLQLNPGSGGPDCGKLVRAHLGTVCFATDDQAELESVKLKWNEKVSSAAATATPVYLPVGLRQLGPAAAAAAAAAASLPSPPFPVDCVFLFDGLASVWSSESVANSVLAGLASCVPVGGLVAGIVPDASQIWSLAQKRALANELAAKKRSATTAAAAADVTPAGLIDSELFSISFECGSLDEFFPFGTKYALRLDDGQVSEQYVVHPKSLLRLFRANGFQVTDYSNFLDFFEDHKRNHYDELKKTGVLSSASTSTSAAGPKKSSGNLLPKQAELISLYSTFVARRIH